ncbi:hypothetical protein V8C34DRAFT_271429 [Trichoderma compactum]
MNQRGQGMRQTLSCLGIRKISIRVYVQIQSTGLTTSVRMVRRAKMVFFGEILPVANRHKRPAPQDEVLDVPSKMKRHKRKNLAYWSKDLEKTLHEKRHGEILAT